MALSSRLPSGFRRGVQRGGDSPDQRCPRQVDRLRVALHRLHAAVRAGGDCIQFPVAFGGLRHLLCDGVVHQPDDGRAGLVLGKFLQDGLDLGVQPGDRIQKQRQGSQQRRQAQPCPQTRRQRGGTAHRHASFLRIMFAFFA